MRYRCKLKLWNIEIENDNSYTILQVRLHVKSVFDNNFKVTVYKIYYSLEQKVCLGLEKNVLNIFFIFLNIFLK